MRRRTEPVRPPTNPDPAAFLPPDESVDQHRTYRLTSLGRCVVRLETARLAELVGLATRWLGPEGKR